MNKFSFSDRLRIDQAGIIFGLLLTAFLIGASVGCTHGLWVNNGNNDLAISEGIKFGLLGMLLIIVSMVIGKIEPYLESKFKLPFFASFGIGTGFVIAIMDGAGMLLQVQSGRLWLNMLSGFIQGTIGAGIAGILIQKTQKIDNASPEQ